MRKNGKNVGKKLVIALLLVNSLSYVGARAYWYATGAVAAELQRVREVGSSGVMNYFVAGNINQPERAFKFLEEKIDGGITYVTYAETRGCSMKQIVNQVLADAQQQNCKVRIFDRRLRFAVCGIGARRRRDDRHQPGTAFQNPEALRRCRSEDSDAADGRSDRAVRVAEPHSLHPRVFLRILSRPMARPVLLFRRAAHHDQHAWRHL